LNPLLDDLNPVQQDAVTAPDGPLLILAGAGSGKTRVLTRRIAHLIADRGVAPWRIAGVTFTNKAAEEMRQRVAGLAGPGGSQVWLHTFHALGARLLRVHGTALKLPPGFTILDDDDSESLVKDGLKTLGLAGDVQASDVWRAIGKARGAGASVADFREMAEGPFDEAVGRAWAAYEAAKARSGAVDFDDLILLPTRLLTEYPEVAARVHEQLTHVLVDEYQDTSPSQYRMLQALLGPGRNLTCVGDPDQSIYRWRGADIRNILEFERDFPDATVVAMNQNYRSTGRILEAASGLIEKNPQIRPKRLWTEGGAGRPLATAQLADEAEEAHFVAGSIARWMRAGATAGDFAVLYRTHAQSRALEEAFAAHRLPYAVIGGLKFYARREVKDLLAWLRLLANPADAVSLTRALGAPPRGIGDASLAKLSTAAASDPRPALELLGSQEFLAGLPPRARTAVAEFLGVLNRMSQALAEGGFTAALTVALEESGYLAWLEQKQGGRSTDAADRRDNLRELLAAVRTAQESGLTLPEYLERAALMADLDRWRGESDLVTLMTLHNAKGLEFPHVFIAGMEDGLLPHASSMDDPEELQEERRLLYVGLTRARESIVLTGARGRRTYERFTWNQPSRFLEEIPAHLLIPVDGPGDLPLAENAVRRAAAAPPPAGMTRIREEADHPDGDDDLDMPSLNEDVRHAHFGTGRVIQVQGRGPDTRIVVSFARYGKKTFLAGMARLTRVRELAS